MLIFFANWREVFRTCGKIFPAALSKLNFTCSLELLEKSFCFSDEKRSLFQFQTMKKKITATQREFFAGVVNTLFSEKLQKKIWGNVFFLKKNLFLNRFLALNETFPACCRIVSVKVVKSDISVGVQKKDLRESFFFKKTYLFLFSDIQRKFFRLAVE